MLAIHAAYRDEVPFPKEKLVGEWDFAKAGQRVQITWTDPYRTEEGYLMFLPGLESSDVYKGAIVHVPNTYENEEEQRWYTLKHLCIFTDSIELLPLL